MSAVWPAGLPEHVDEDGFSIEPRDNVIRSETEVGPQKARRRATKATEIMQCQVSMGISQFNDTFKLFWHETIRDGSLPFEWEDPRDGTSQVFLPTRPYRMRIIGDTRVRVRMELELR